MHLSSGLALVATAAVLAAVGPSRVSASPDAKACVPATATTTSAAADVTYTATTTATTTTSNPYAPPSIYTPCASNAASAPPPTTTLTPVVPPYINPGDLGNLIPSSNCSFYYTNGTTDLDLDHIFGVVNATLQYTAVVLPHTSYVSSLVCDSAGLDVFFSDDEAYEYVKEHWPSSDFLLITDSLNCSQYEDGVHTYWLVEDLVYSDSTRSVQVDGREIAIENALDQIELVWGTYTANGTAPGCPYSGGAGDGMSGGSNYTNTTNSGYPSNGTNSTGSTNSSFASCQNPPSSYLGLPTAACGFNFDDILDAKYGFFDFNNETQLSDFDTDYDDTEADSGVDDNDLRRRGYVVLQRRVCFSCAFKKLVTGIKTAVKSGVASAVSGAKAVGTFIKDTASSLASLSVNPSYDKDLTVSSSPSTLTSSPWGQQYLIYTATKTSSSGSGSGTINLYCVDCHVTGTAHIHGAASFSLTSGLTAANVGLTGKLDAGVYLGLDASASYEYQLTKTIATIPIPDAGLVIPKVVTLGVFAQIDAETKVNINAQGQILAGAGLAINNFQATLDFVNKANNKISGFTPVVTSNFTANAQVTASVEVGLPFELAVGMELPLLSKKWTVGLKNTPAVTGTLAVDVAVGTSATSSSSCPNGVEVGLNLGDTLAVDFLGTDYTLTSISKSLYSNCYSIPGLSSGGSSTISVTATTATDDSTATDESTATDAATATDSDTSETPTIDSETTDSTTTTEPVRRRRRSGNLDRRAFLYPRAPIATESETETASATSTAATSTITSSSASSTTTSDGVVISSYDPATESGTNDTFYSTLSSDLSEDEGEFDGNGTTGDVNSTYVSLVDVSGTYSLGEDEWGNFMLDDAANAGNYLFYSNDQLIDTDEQNNVFFYFPDEMTALGVSRFRVKNDTSVPKVADVVFLVPIDYDDSSNTTGVYVALNTNEDIFYTVACSITGIGNKVFLVANITEGITTLQKTELEYVVTGGVVENCGLVMFASKFEGY
ncbi:hypothetical protein HK405_009451 [Cladochytrium tenue]|nr:hypothetical protein HK405_009451 [Cladochytrium tenue]